MEFQSYCCYILINCLLLFPSFLTKPVSLNDIIAAEERASLKKNPIKLSETQTDIAELPKNFKLFTTTLTKHITTDDLLTGPVARSNKKISPLTYKKTFLIRAPLRPKKIKYSHKPRSRRINTTSKREIDNDAKFNKNYIPILKNLSVLFNNILSSDSGSDEDTKQYNNKLQSFPKNRECSCTGKSDYKNTERKPPKKTTTIISSIAPTIPAKTKTLDLTETSSTSAYNTFNDNISALRRNKNLPLLSARDSISSWRNNNGFSEGSIATHNENIEGHITGSNGSDENNNSRRKTTTPYTKNHKQHTNGGSGNDASSDEYSGRIGRNGYISSAPNKAPTVETTIGPDETIGNDRGDGNQFKGFDNFEDRRNKTESGILLSQSSSRLRRLESQEETSEISWKIEKPKESIFEVTYNFTRNQRLSNRDGAVASEDQEFRRPNKNIRQDQLPINLINSSKSNLNQDKQKIVVIYDGYSVAKDVNGENKITEKAYHIHS